jgi:excisionase family DNA binding protein
MDELLTTQQAAERLGITDSRVRQLILEGKLPAKKFGRSNMIRASDLKAVEGIKRGRPPKAQSVKAAIRREKGKRGK